MGRNSGTLSTLSNNLAEWGGSPDSGGHEVCILDIIDGCLLDDGGSATSNNIHDSYGKSTSCVRMICDLKVILLVNLLIKNGLLIFSALISDHLSLN